MADSTATVPLSAAELAETFAASLDRYAERIENTQRTKYTLAHETYWTTRDLDRASLVVLDAHLHGLFSSNKPIVDRIEWRLANAKPTSVRGMQRRTNAYFVIRELEQLIIDPARNGAALTFKAEADVLRKLAGVIRETAGIRKTPDDETANLEELVKASFGPRVAEQTKKAAIMLARGCSHDEVNNRLGIGVDNSTAIKSRYVTPHLPPKK